MSKWFGVQREWTSNGLDFMAKAAWQCRACQSEGQCSWGTEDCMGCKWQAPMAAIKDLDQFMQSRIEDRADAIETRMNILAAQTSSYFENQKKRDARQAVCLWAMLGVVIVAVILCIAVA